MVSGFFISPAEAAHLFDIEGMITKETGRTLGLSSLFLQQPAMPVSKQGQPPLLMTLGESALVAPLAPAANAVSDRQDIVSYVVEDGDTPSSIASRFGITLSTLLWANRLTERSVIRPGQELLILPVSGVKHEVHRGETIASIAKRYQANAEDIIDFNDLPATGEIFIGDTLIVPGGKILPPPAGRRSYPRVTLPQLATDFFLAPAHGRNFGRLHGFNGVDIANACGTAIFASAAGVVTVADGSGWNGGYGKFVRVRHPNGIETLYAHMRSLAVVANQPIGKGEYLGEMGTTGRSSGCHVHFEVRGARNPFAR